MSRLIFVRCEPARPYRPPPPNRRRHTITTDSRQICPAAAAAASSSVIRQIFPASTLDCCRAKTTFFLPTSSQNKPKKFYNPLRRTPPRCSRHNRRRRRPPPVPPPTSRWQECRWPNRQQRNWNGSFWAGERKALLMWLGLYCWFKSSDIKDKTAVCPWAFTTEPSKIFESIFWVNEIRIILKKWRVKRVWYTKESRNENVIFSYIKKKKKDLYPSVLVMIILISYYIHIVVLGLKEIILFFYLPSFA